MIGCKLLADISDTLNITRKGPKASLPFGNISILFAGDFCQLPLTNTTKLYTNLDHLLLFAKFLANAEIQKIMHQLSAHNTPKSPPFWMILSGLESAEVGKFSTVNKKAKFQISKFIEFLTIKLF